MIGLKKNWFIIDPEDTPTNVDVTGSGDWGGGDMMGALRNPLVIRFNLPKDKCQFDVHPLKRQGNNANKTVVEMAWGTDPRLFRQICLTPFDMNATLEPFIKKYNDIVNEFNTEAEVLAQKYSAEYMLHSIGRKDCLI